jgi:uncharacterized membrane protein YqaE (UPF0057 family)
MKLIQQTMILTFFMLFLVVGFGAQRANTEPIPAAKVLVKKNSKAEKAEMRKAKRQARKAMLKSLFSRKDKKDEVEDLLLIILAIIIPPVAVFLYDDGTSPRFWLNLIFALLGIGVGALFWAPGVGVMYTVAIVHALLIVLGLI